MPEWEADPARLTGANLSTWYTTPSALREARREEARLSAYASYFGQLRAAQAPELPFREEQAAFARERRELDQHNSWLAVPALAPALTVMALEGAGALALRYGAKAIPKGPVFYSEPEPWQLLKPERPTRLPSADKAAIRRAARTRLARANGQSAADLGAQVHHSDPLEFAHLKPNADPNRLANLWALPKEAHDIATAEWDAFRRALQGRTPSVKELMQVKLRIDELVQQYLVRPGASRPLKPPTSRPPQ